MISKHLCHKYSPNNLEQLRLTNITQGRNTEATYEAQWNFSYSAFSLGRGFKNICEEMWSCVQVLSSQWTQVCTKGETNYLLSPYPNAFRLLMNLYSVRHVETSYGASKSRYDRFGHKTQACQKSTKKIYPGLDIGSVFFSLISNSTWPLTP